MSEVSGARAEVGAALKSIRVKKGLTVDVISQHTRIPKKFLEAIEDNRFDELPAPAYLRGFLKNYCDYLDMEFEPLWNSALQQMGPAAPKLPPQAPHQDLPAPKSKIFTVVFLLSILTGFLIFLWALSGKKETPSVPAPPAVPPALAPVQKQAGPRLLIEFRDDSWVSLKIDGEPKFEGRAPKNSRQEWKARKTISLLTPTPDRLKLSLNGLPYKLPAQDQAGYYNIESP
ncbi:MAG: hypothetical protein A3J74_11410 [Elusimicrobia bacterium RIFCSPHIGHO2_02_FULL_57_9]|nr:MAG: hypothetical protein A3J74_11410 [Elusimicrobia bacterium RIFCSPHIGHO2_02_FULL_57_9]